MKLLVELYLKINLNVAKFCKVINSDDKIRMHTSD